MTEEFRTLSIPEYGEVKVGNLGTIIGKHGKFKPTNNNNKGYYRVYIGNHFYAVHRLVAICWIPNIDNKPQVNHIDGNKSNNTFYNLEWCTNKENMKHAVRNNLTNSKISYKDALDIRKKYNTGKYSCIALEKMYGIAHSTLMDVIKGRTWES